DARAAVRAERLRRLQLVRRGRVQLRGARRRRYAGGTDGGQPAGMSRLFTPVQVGPIEARNRAWVSPMCQYSCERQDGMPGEWHHEHLASFARGGAGLVMTEAAAVVPE